FEGGTVIVGLCPVRHSTAVATGIERGEVGIPPVGEVEFGSEGEVHHASLGTGSVQTAVVDGKRGAEGVDDGGAVVVVAVVGVPVAGYQPNRRLPSGSPPVA